MPSWFAGNTRAIVLKYTGGGTAAAVTISVRGYAGVDLGAVGWALGLESSSVRLNGHFVSRGVDLVSTLSWESLLSFFASRGFPVGGSILDPILVQGKLIAHTGWILPANTQDGHLSLKRKQIGTYSSPPKRCRILDGSSNMHYTGIDQEIDDVCCIKLRLKLDEKQPLSKGMSDGSTSGSADNGMSSPALFKDATKPTKLSTVSSETWFNCSFINEFGKRPRRDDVSNALSYKSVK